MFFLRFLALSLFCTTSLTLAVRFSIDMVLCKSYNDKCKEKEIEKWIELKTGVPEIIWADKVLRIEFKLLSEEENATTTEYKIYVKKSRKKMFKLISEPILNIEHGKEGIIKFDIKKSRNQIEFNMCVKAEKNMK